MSFSGIKAARHTRSINTTGLGEFRDRGWNCMTCGASE